MSLRPCFLRLETVDKLGRAAHTPNIRIQPLRPLNREIVSHTHRAPVWCSLRRIFERSFREPSAKFGPEPLSKQGYVLGVKHRDMIPRDVKDFNATGRKTFPTELRGDIESPHVTALGSPKDN